MVHSQNQKLWKKHNIIIYKLNVTTTDSSEKTLSTAARPKEETLHQKDSIVETLLGETMTAKTLHALTEQTTGQKRHSRCTGTLVWDNWSEKTQLSRSTLFQMVSDCTQISLHFNDQQL